jgi:TonB family protein
MSQSRANRRARRGSSTARTLGALLAALSLHAASAWLLAALGSWDGLMAGHRRASIADTAARNGGDLLAGARVVAEEDRPIEIQALVDELARPEAKTAEEKKREEQKKREEEDPRAKGQVVDIARPAIEARPDEARFVAEYDSRVARETRGPIGRDKAGEAVAVRGGDRSRIGAEPHPDAAMAGGLPGPRALRRAGGQSGPRTRAERHGLLGQDGSAETLSADGDSARAGAPGAPGAPAASPAREGGSDGDAAVDRLGMGEEGSGGPGEPRLSPTEEMLTRAMGKGAGSSDWLRDVDDGESTALNAKHFKFAPFFNRMRRAVADEWRPDVDVLMLRHDPTGHVYGSRDRITLVRVHLRPDGSVEDVTLLESSGVAFLDEAARDSFRRAGPFVNPPTQLVEADGLIHFNFGFCVDLSGHGKVKVFRYK